MKKADTFTAEVVFDIGEDMEITVRVEKLNCPAPEAEIAVMKVAFAKLGTEPGTIVSRSVYQDYE